MVESRRDTVPVLAVSPAPHVGGLASTGRLNWSVACCLVPAAAWGVFVFGLAALRVLGVSLGASLAAELLTSLAWRRVTLADGSAAVTGLLVGMLMPPGVPLYVPAVASVFAIIIVKQSFGGLGRNWMNPALGGVVFVLFSWPNAMNSWLPARGVAASARDAPSAGCAARRAERRPIRSRRGFGRAGRRELSLEHGGRPGGCVDQRAHPLPGGVVSPGRGFRHAGRKYLRENRRSIHPFASPRGRLPAGPPGHPLAGTRDVPRDLLRRGAGFRRSSDGPRVGRPAARSSSFSQGAWFLARFSWPRTP